MHRDGRYPKAFLTIRTFGALAIDQAPSKTEKVYNSFEELVQSSVKIRRSRRRIFMFSFKEVTVKIFILKKAC